MRAFITRIPFIMIALVPLVGCTVGPDFIKPEPAVPDRYTESPTPSQTVAAASQTGEAQNFAFARELPGQWWKLFGSSELDLLIKKGLEKNPSLAAAQAALRKSEEDLRAIQGSTLFPAVNANLQATRQRTSDNVNQGPGNTYNLYNTSVGVSYTLDIFGGGRRLIESYQAQVDYQRFVAEATYLTLTANIVTTSIQEASLRAQLAATREIIAAEQKQLDLLGKQFELGAVSKAAVLAQEADADAIFGAEAHQKRAARDISKADDAADRVDGEP